MDFSLNNDVETLGAIIDSINRFPFSCFFVLDPTTYIHESFVIFSDG